MRRSAVPPFLRARVIVLVQGAWWESSDATSAHAVPWAVLRRQLSLRRLASLRRVSACAVAPGGTARPALRPVAGCIRAADRRGRRRGIRARDAGTGAGGGRREGGSVDARRRACACAG